jgi:hypothetical protein
MQEGRVSGVGLLSTRLKGVGIEMAFMGYD